MRGSDHQWGVGVGASGMGTHLERDKSATRLQHLVRLRERVGVVLAVQRRLHVEHRVEAVGLQVLHVQVVLHHVVASLLEVRRHLRGDLTCTLHLVRVDGDARHVGASASNQAAVV